MSWSDVPEAEPTTRAQRQTLYKFGIPPKIVKQATKEKATKLIDVLCEIVRDRNADDDGSLE